MTFPTFYKFLLKLSSKTMKTTTSVSAIQRRIAINVVGLVPGALSNFMAFHARCFTGYISEYNSKGHWKVKIIFFQRITCDLHKIELVYMPQLFILLAENILIPMATTFLVGTTLTKLFLKCRYFDHMIYTRGHLY